MSARTFSDRLYGGRHFPQNIIILCVRWYVTYRLSYRDFVETMAEPGVYLAHSTILRWVLRYVPEFVKRWDRHRRPVGCSWQADETYIQIKGIWHYQYRSRQARSNGRFLPERNTGHWCGDDVLAQSACETSQEAAAQDYGRRI